MNARIIIKTIFLSLLFTRLSLAQGGPYLTDYLFPPAWPNPASTVQSNWLDPDVPSTVLDGQTMYVANTTLLAQKQKDYYWFQDDAKQSGLAHKLMVDNNSCRVWLEWQGYFYPRNGEYDCEFDAIPFDQLDPKCFTALSGPYCDIPSGVIYVGPIDGYPWVAIGGLFGKMGGAFSATKKEKILDRNFERNDEVLRSDLRQELVDEFLGLYPESNPNDIPVDYLGDELISDAGYNHTAVVRHILPAIAPKGNAAGRNVYSNAMVVSSHMEKQLTNSVTGAGYMPSDAMLLYFEYLAANHGAKSAAAAESKITGSYIRDWRDLDGLEIEVLTEDETRVVMQYTGLIRPFSSKTGRK